ncbi:keratin-associated protein 13-3 [Saimiri boliviensis]|uniref:keratin-associated protein 13-3 n=1 Tax=Saimiri boliviensis TaxID=27679 RepID=UPI00193C9223|nr:keratin-associated protein 13-3 [Saimiri boliviensis boliviensis]
MSFNCCSRNFSSHSCGGYLPYPGSSCGSSYPSNLVYSTDLCSPRTSQLGSCLYRACEETYWDPTSCQTSCVKSSPCQTFCCYLRTPMLCNSCSTVQSKSLGFGSSSCCSHSNGSRSCSSLSYGSNGFRTLNYGIHAFPSQS